MKRKPRLYRKLVDWLESKNIPISLAIAVVVGIGISKIFTVLSHLLLHWLADFPSLDEPMFDRRELIISLVIHSVFAVLGAFIAAWMAKKRAKKAVFIVGTKEIILWILGIILLWKHYPAWFNMAKAALGMPLALLGGKIYSLTQLAKQQIEGSSNPPE